MSYGIKYQLSLPLSMSVQRSSCFAVCSDVHVDFISVFFLLSALAGVPVGDSNNEDRHCNISEYNTRYSARTDSITRVSVYEKEHAVEACDVPCIPFNTFM